MWLALVTHPLLDTLTIYGTQLLRLFGEANAAQRSAFRGGITGRQMRHVADHVDA